MKFNFILVAIALACADGAEARDRYPQFSPKLYPCDGGGATYEHDLVGTVLRMMEDEEQAVREIVFSKKFVWKGTVPDNFSVLDKYKQSDEKFIVGGDYHLGLHKLHGSNFYYFDHDCFTPKKVDDRYIERINNLKADAKCRLKIPDQEEMAFKSDVIVMGRILEAGKIEDSEYNRKLVVKVRESIKGGYSEGDSIDVFYRYSTLKECVPGSSKYEYSPGSGDHLFFLRQKDKKFFITREFGFGGNILKISEMKFGWKSFFAMWWWREVFYYFAGKWGIERPAKSESGMLLL